MPILILLIVGGWLAGGTVIAILIGRSIRLGTADAPQLPDRRLRLVRGG